MEFKTLNNIENSFQYLRIFGIVFVCLCAIITGYAVYKSYDYAEAQRQKIYVLGADGSLVPALYQDMSANRPLEARNHIRRFLELLFNLAPDRDAIESNIRRALYLADRSAFNHYQNLMEKGYYNQVIAGNINQRIEIDSISCDFNVYPYDVIAYAKLLIIREKSITERSLVISGKLQDCVRSDNNVHGFLVENFQVLENRDLRVIDR